MELLACLLIIVALLERLWKWAAGVKRSGRSLASPGFDEFTAAFQSTKRIQLEQRQAESMLRDDETDGAPPANRIDLTRRKVSPPANRIDLTHGKVVISVPDKK
ncbi:DUF6191 domain-containing protein [Streptosporangium roseum]|uniref:DUF6191 domain-containing protein n=1 Tax=Streptosporangium roseum TaxID=2001 RepID=UPI0012DFC8EF|nr:DUF6191 domain-containing protein [Streptosporangium roseum]